MTTATPQPANTARAHDQAILTARLKRSPVTDRWCAALACALGEGADIETAIEVADEVAGAGVKLSAGHDVSEQSRGQPENKGEFGPGGGGQAKKPAARQAAKPQARFSPNSLPKKGETIAYYDGEGGGSRDAELVGQVYDVLSDGALRVKSRTGSLVNIPPEAARPYTAPPKAPAPAQKPAQPQATAPAAPKPPPPAAAQPQKPAGETPPALRKALAREFSTDHSGEGVEIGNIYQRMRINDPTFKSLKDLHHELHAAADRGEIELVKGDENDSSLSQPDKVMRFEDGSVITRIKPGKATQLSAAWQESKHKRGQPQNKGEFARKTPDKVTGVATAKEAHALAAKQREEFPEYDHVVGTEKDGWTVTAHPKSAAAPKAPDKVTGIATAKEAYALAAKQRDEFPDHDHVVGTEKDGWTVTAHPKGAALSAAWDEKQHKRGQPQNKGEFAKQPQTSAGKANVAAVRDDAGEPSARSQMPRPGHAPQTAMGKQDAAAHAGQKKPGPDVAAIKAQRQPNEPDKAFAKRVIDKLQVGKLPEDHGKYFNVEKAAGTVPIDQFVSAKTDAENEQGGANAPARMWAASQGLLAKRDPITVKKLPDGKYQVLDGNGTFTAAKAQGWKSLPVQMEQAGAAPAQPAREAQAQPKSAGAPAAQPAHGAAATRSFFTPEELALPKETNQPIAPNAGYAGLVGPGQEATRQLQQLLDLGKGVGAQLGYTTHQPKSAEEFNALMEQPGGMVILAPMKGEKRATEKVASDYGGDWSKLIDVARASIVVDSYDDVEKTVAKLRANGTTFARAPKDRMSTRKPPGYRDMLTNVKLPNGIVGELQILVKPMMKAKIQGHHAYEITRGIEARTKLEGDRKRTPREDEEYRRATREMEELYDGAWTKCGGLK